MIVSRYPAHVFAHCRGMNKPVLGSDGCKSRTRIHWTQRRINHRRGLKQKLALVEISLGLDVLRQQ